MEKVIVLGAGIQGVCVALALQAKGYAVTLIDKASDCMLRASLRNEGKIHLGLIYANDPSFRTSALMLKAALAFAGLVEEYLGESIDWKALRSRPYLYIVAKDSLLSADELTACYAKLQAEYLELNNGTNA